VRSLSRLDLNDPRSQSGYFEGGYTRFGSRRAPWRTCSTCTTSPVIVK